MICSKEEFLLVLSKWMSSSQSVVLMTLLGEREGLSSISVMRFTGYVKHVDRDGWFFVIAREAAKPFTQDSADDFAKIALDDWEFAYADPLEKPAMADGLIGIPSPVKEAFSLTKPNHAKLSLIAVGSL